MPTLRCLEPQRSDPRRSNQLEPVAAIPKASCSFIVDTWALKGLPYHNFGVYVYTIKLHGAFGNGSVCVSINNRLRRREEKARSNPRQGSKHLAVCTSEFKKGMEV